MARSPRAVAPSWRLTRDAIVGAAGRAPAVAHLSFAIILWNRGSPRRPS
jgi:hypothetical protein